MATRRAVALQLGVIHTEHHHVAGHGDRRVRVYVPAAYDGSKDFPLLVMFDGQNVFDDHGSYAGGWRVHRAVERLGKKRSRPIVIGIDHGHEGRIDELAAWGYGGHGRGRGRRGGRADSFIGWIVDHLLPDVRRRYRVIEGPRGVLICGSSLGGLAATYAHFKWPHVFGGMIALSPSYWLGGSKIFDFVGAQAKPWTTRVYVDAGAREGGAARNVERMAKLLRSRGYGEHDLMAKIDPKGTHDERAWRRRLPAALRFFYQ